MVWYGWLAYALLWVTVVAVFPVRLNVFALFSLFDAKVGVRVGIFGARVVRVWASLADKTLLLNGKSYHPKRHKGSRARTHGVGRKRVGYILALLGRIGCSVEMDCLVGLYDARYNWLPVALADLLRMPRVVLRVRSSDEQVCKGLIKGKITLTIWDVVLAALVT